MALSAPLPARSAAPLSWPGLLLGFALGGFFDGILLHQILQWHHLLSALQTEGTGDLRFQILADGLFHALMYAIGGIGLWRLWRERERLARPGADRLLLADALIGFGLWHVVDTLLSHWITGIHRVRMDSPNPLLWDLIWLAAFGLAPLAAGVLWRRRLAAGGAGRAAPMTLALAVLAAGPVAALPPPDVTAVVVYFRPGTTPQGVFAAVAAVEGRVLWGDRSGSLWAVELGEGAGPKAARLYRHGALLVSNSAFPLGCLAWSRGG